MKRLKYVTVKITYTNFISLLLEASNNLNFVNVIQQKQVSFKVW